MTPLASTKVKICGLTTPGTVDAAVEAGADYLGFVVFERSPRALTVQAAGRLIERARGRALSVVLLVDPGEALIDAVAALGPDLLQLHGRETPERVAALRARFGGAVIKALPVGVAADLRAIPAFERAADFFMLDARPPEGADRSGGHGEAFDWSLLGSQATTHHPLWFLAGGLTPANVAEAIRVTRAPAVDVSSGVESAPGVKDAALIAAFIRAAKAAAPDTP